MDAAPRERVELAPWTTLELGGPARYFAEATDEATVADALRWARGRELTVTVLGGGSNVVVADAGVRGLVLRMALREVSVERSGDGTVRVTVSAGEPWDELVARAVAEGWAGLECLSGIPGTAGATPIQNVGAYGQEVAETIERVRVLDRASLDVVELAPAELGLGYRSSLLRTQPDRFIVLAVTFRLLEGGAATVRYPELAAQIGATAAPPSLAVVREAVLALRRSKSMVVSADDPNRRSVGSFFVNPVLDPDQLGRLANRLDRLGVGDRPPSFTAGGGRAKVPAAWLVERAGFGKGYCDGNVGVSSRHSLALINRGGASTAELVALAGRIQRGVDDLFGIRLRPEPVFLGFRGRNPLESAGV
jgi:UDP-N-acetylmuramate dehydrogenase